MSRLLSSEGTQPLQKKGLVIAVSGKGGVGKTTTAALMVKILSEANQRSILVIDANPDSNLPEVFGIPVTRTVAMVVEELRRSMERSEIPPEMTKEDILETRIFGILKETPNFDLLVMGRGEGEGCYCPVNALLTRIVDRLSKNYDLTIMDMEAGLEHLSRRTDRDVDIMIVVTDPSSMGLQTAKRIKEVAREVHIQFKKFYLIGNRFKPEMEPMLREEAHKIGCEFIGIIPSDENISSHNLTGKPLLSLPPGSPAMPAMKQILTQMGLLK